MFGGFFLKGSPPKNTYSSSPETPNRKYSGTELIFDRGQGKDNMLDLNGRIQVRGYYKVEGSISNNKQHPPTVLSN